jgi:peptidoglycan/LPS O-acetylase OafA/YrhL
MWLIQEMRYQALRVVRFGMDYYSVWPMALAFCLLLCLIATPLFKVADAPPTNAKIRVSTLDGLRGFLAFEVFFGHAAIYHQYLIDGTWGKVPTGPYYGFAASTAVALFFMITGYLFWGQLLKANGKPNWIKLYVGRLFRLGPLYLFAMCWMLLFVGAGTGFTLHVPFSALTHQIAHWSLLGADRMQPDVNGYKNTTIVLSGVTWTLFYEWRFYASLLLLALFARLPGRMHLMAVGAAAVTILCYLFIAKIMGSSPVIFAAIFLAGMMCASLEKQQLLPHFGRAKLSVLAVVLIVAYALTCTTAFSPLGAAMLGAIFCLIVAGADFFGVLTSKPAKRMGDISFGIYLLQGLVMTGLFSASGTRDFALSSPLHHWLLVYLAAILLLAVATICYALIERPGIELGQRIAKQLGAVFQRLLAPHIQLPQVEQIGIRTPVDVEH